MKPTTKKFVCSPLILLGLIFIFVSPMWAKAMPLNHGSQNVFHRDQEDDDNFSSPRPRGKKKSDQDDDDDHKKKPRGKNSKHAAHHEDDDEGHDDDDNDGPQQDDDDDGQVGGEKVSICHIPKGNPQNVRIISVSVSAAQKHIDKHGDSILEGGIEVCTPNSKGKDLCHIDFSHLEVCDGVDNDCDGQIDEELGQQTCGIGACENTVDNCQNAQEVECQPNAPSATEICGNGIDDNCDGISDEGDSSCVVLPSPSCACIESVEDGVIVLNGAFFDEPLTQNIIQCGDPIEGTSIVTDQEEILLVEQPGGGYCGLVQGPVVRNLDDQLFENCSEFVQLKTGCFTE